MDNNHLPEWVIPTAAGMGVATLRRFRRNPDETRLAVIVRFFAHVATCMIAGYITGGVIDYFNYPKLVAPVCALAGLYGTTLALWVEDAGMAYLNHFLKNKIEDK